MAISIACAGCGKRFSVGDAYAGKKVRCSQCRGVIVVPAPGVAASGPPPLPGEMDLAMLQSVAATERAPALAGMSAGWQPGGGVACPSCRGAMAPAARLCVSCGYDRQTGRHISAKVAHAPTRLEATGMQLLKNPWIWVHAVGVLGFMVCIISADLSYGASVAYNIAGVGLMIVGLAVALISVWPRVTVGTWLLARFIPIIFIILLFVGIAGNFGLFCRRLVIGLHGVPLFVMGLLLAIRGGHMPKWPEKPPEPPVMSSPGTPNASPAAESHVTFPERPATGSISAGAERFSVRLSGTGPGANMQVVVYLPRGMSGVARHSLGCVFIAPAGTSMLNGSELGGGDSPEHLPYAGAGYAVCAYELDGSKPDHSTVGEMATAIRAFRAARFGLTNAHNAIEYVLAKFPEVDSGRLYAAGHSSAGTVALLLAADEPRIKGCMAYAPGTDILHFQRAAFFNQMEGPVPDVRKYAKDGSPTEYVGMIRCPLFLFHAGDDTVVSSQSIQEFTEKLQKAGKVWEEKDVASGGHYDSMIREGIPAGIAWLKRLPTERGK